MITFAELVPLYLTALAVTLPLITFRTWRRERVLTLNLRNDR
jgi:hypothetical protein